MGKPDRLTQGLALVGDGLVWFPVLAPVLAAVSGWAADRQFQFDYLMPAELFPMVLAGAGLLGWAAWRARSRRGLIGAGLGAALGCLVLGSAVAGLTGLATGAREPVGWPWALVLAALGGYCAAVGVMGVGGALLVREAWRPAPRA